MRLISFVFLMVLAVQCFAANGEFTGKVVSVIDGNTFEILTEDQQTKKFILAGIDAPELAQPYGDKAKKMLEKLLLNELVKVVVEGKNRWGYMAIVTITRNNSDPRHELLEEGLAWTAEQNPAHELEKIRQKAEQKTRGLWKDQEPTAPWVFRREQSMLQAKSSD